MLSPFIVIECIQCLALRLAVVVASPREWQVSAVCVVWQGTESAGSSVVGGDPG